VPVTPRRGRRGAAVVGSGSDVVVGCVRTPPQRLRREPIGRIRLLAGSRKHGARGGGLYQMSNARSARCGFADDKGDLARASGHAP